MVINNATFTNSGGNLSADRFTTSNSATATLSGGTITLDNDLDLKSSSTVNISTTVTKSGGGDDDINLGTGTSINISPGAYISGFNDVDFDGSGGVTFDMTGGTLDVTDDFKIQDGDNNSISVSGGILNVGDDFSIESDDNTISFSGSADINIDDDLNFDGDDNALSSSGNATVDIAEEITDDGSNASINVGGNSSFNSDSIDDFSIVTQESSVSGNLGPNVLPVEFLSFSSTVNEDGEIMLEWLTGSELNNDYFTVERSTESAKWIEVGVVAGAGNSSQEIAYEFIDQDTDHEAGAYYYRIKQTDFNGNFDYSQTISHLVNVTETGELSIFPNPATSILYVKKLGMALDPIQIFNLQGQEISQLVTQSGTFSHGITINIDNLPTGAYFVISNNRSIKFIKH